MERIKSLVEGRLAGKQVSDSGHPAHPVEKKLLFRDNDEYAYLNLDDIIFIHSKTPTSISGCSIFCFGGGRVPHRSPDVQL